MFRKMSPRQLLSCLVSFVAMGIRSVSQAVEPPPTAERIAIWSGEAPIGDGTFEASNAFVFVHSPAKPNGAAVIICPGGGYNFLVAQQEGHGVARWFNQHGITGIVLQYRLPKRRPMVPLLDAQQAIRLVRSRAKGWNLDPHKIGIMGFSAGGHVAATAATHFDLGDGKSSDPIHRESSRPDFSILIYPVVSMGPLSHLGSRMSLIGTAPTPELIKEYSNELQVTDKTPPAFLAHAKDDAKVSPENSRLFADALKAHNVPVEYLELPSGGHGLNGYQGPMWEAWKTASLKWLAAQKFIPEEEPTSKNSGEPLKKP